MRKFFPVLVFFALIFQNGKSATWIANSPGYWNSSFTWSTGIAPPYTSSDTFIIRAPVALTNNLWFGAGAHVQIDSAGGLCGHYNLHLDSGTTMLKYGILELDILAINYGHATLLAPGQVILTQYCVVTGMGATLTINGPSMAIGPWFNCVMPKYSFTGIEEEEASTFNLFPNPSAGSFTLSCPSLFSKAFFRLRDVTGRMVYEKTIFSSNETIDVSFLRNGIYFWDMDAGNKVSARGKIEIIK